jgi:hypothetical protein
MATPDNKESKVSKVGDAVEVCANKACNLGWKEEHTRWYSKWAEAIVLVKSFSDANKKEPYHRQLDNNGLATSLPPWKLPTLGGNPQVQVPTVQLTVPTFTTHDTVEPIFHTKLDGTTYSRANRAAALAATSNTSAQQARKQLGEVKCNVCKSAEDGDNLQLVLCDYAMAHGEDAVGYHVQCLDSLSAVPEGAFAVWLPHVNSQWGFVGGAGEWMCPLCEKHMQENEDKWMVDRCINKRSHPTGRGSSRKVCVGLHLHWVA